MIRSTFIGGFAAVLLAASPVSAVEDVTITSTAAGFEPSGTVAILGEGVRWRNDDAVGHTTTGRAPLSLWHRALPAGTVRTRTFTQSGTFPYFCRIHPTMKGQVRVGIGVSADVVEVGERLVVRLATKAAPDGFRYRVQRRRVGGTWKTWRIVTSRTTAWKPKGGATGEWQLRARTERRSNGAASRYSPVREVEIVPG